jgi:hypothetical protein
MVCNWGAARVRGSTGHAVKRAAASVARNNLGFIDSPPALSDLVKTNHVRVHAAAYDGLWLVDCQDAGASGVE